VILGSVRAGRHCVSIGAWVAAIAQEATGLRHELVDLADWPLPMDDEPAIPQGGGYVQPHTLAWSRKVASADAFVIVTPQYNWGYPAVLKNALDHLYKEWAGKPLVIVSYGGHGGTKCAAQLRQVVEGIGMRPTPTMPAITLARAMIMGGPIDPTVDFREHADAVRQASAELALMLRVAP
jgi:NAD(P)H-dependent FMN reductase